ncbi:MAG TPA: BamA/TamA family outer membrane protein [Gemmatimonadales bacterium]|nr:BamA/TamA family outer membrane protein [Gemmatimonadales bacterium]
MVKLPGLQHAVNRGAVPGGREILVLECRILPHLPRPTVSIDQRNLLTGLPFRVPVSGAVRCCMLLALGYSVPLSAQEPQRVVRQLEFTENRAISDEVLAAAISTTNSSWFARGLFRWLGLGAKRYFDEQEFRRDVVRLGVLYKRSGYPDAVIDTVVQRTPEDVYITYAITEGRPIQVTSLSITGLDSLRPRWQQLAVQDLPLQQGDPFNRYIMQASADTITRRLRDHGYPTAIVFTGFEVNTDARIASVTMEVDPGQRAAIGRIRVVGAQRIDTSLVRRLLVARPGRRYSQDELFQSQRNLYESDLFRFASVNIDSAGFQPGADSVPLLVQVNEGKFRRIRGGLGYATNDCFRGSLGWTSRNFLGGGRILDLTSRASKVGVGDPVNWGLDENICSASRNDTIGSAKVNFYLGASLRRPAFLSPNNALTLSVFGERRSEYKVYLRQETGVSVAFTRTTPRRRNPLSLTYTLSYGRTEATPQSFCSFFNACTTDVIEPLRQNRILATLTALGTFPRVNSQIDPTRGSFATAELTHSSKYIGSSSLQQFTRFVAGIAWYRPLSRDVVFSWRVRGGLIFSPSVDVASGTGAFIPPEHRFYAGGPNDVRGFDRNELGPVVYVTPQTHADSVRGQGLPIDPDSVRVAATGGNSLALANVEIRVPSPILRSRLRLAVFVDAGGVWQRQGRQSTAVIRVTPGVGLRLATPLGPARFDIAYNPYRLQAGTLFQFDRFGNLTPVPGEGSYILPRQRKYAFHIAVGQPF